MSENNGRSGIVSSPPASTRGGASTAGQGSAQQPSGFNSELNATCLAFVEDYRNLRLSLAEASLEIIQALASDASITESQQKAAYKSFFELLQQHAQLTSASAERGKKLESRPASPSSDGSDSDEEKEPSGPDVQPVSRKRFHEDKGLADRADGGKRRLDESIIPFMRDGASARLNKQLRDTLRLKENYTRNLDSAKQLVISNPEVPEFPQALWKDVLANNFIDLDKVLSGEYSTTGDPKVVEKFGDTGYAFMAGDLKPSKAVRSHGEWTIAWESYTEAVLFAYPHRQKELRVYSAEITRLFCATTLDFADRVIQFDCTARSRVSKSNQLLLSDLGNFSDLSISHFSSAGAGASKPAPKMPALGNRSNDVCRRFNEGVCVSRTCKYRHSCFNCKACDHGANSCGKASGSGLQPKSERK
ncbi:hypothetical protein EWM64_g6516 [Hericium alpestre]|uniref:C3H1-type domain-containing protein n=1 Tax=Hericium alpestre TaxID=135208 RepID=A0A4Y9ZSF2_9AGAM|nr:hypothetical protein EWM64_g6516 [Hericium alpestre]